MQALDLVHPEGKSGDYAFKHALVRDALYQSLLTGPRAALHLKIAEEIERRSGNRLTEVVETLAHHYSQTDRADKAFAYLAMAGAKSLGVYSFDEAGIHFAAAIALLDANPGCADDRQIVEMLSNFALYTTASWQLKVTTATIERFRPSLDRVGDNQDAIIVQHHHVFALTMCGRYREAEARRMNCPPWPRGSAARRPPPTRIPLACILQFTWTLVRPKISREWLRKPLRLRPSSMIPISSILSGLRSALTGLCADACPRRSERRKKFCRSAANSTTPGR